MTVTQRVGKVLIIGLGLIGGSLARSLKQTGFASHVAGHGYRDVSLIKGMEQGVIDSYSLDLDEALAGADIVVIGTPTLKAAEILCDVLRRVSPATVVTDVASVKGLLLQAAKGAMESAVAPSNLVLGHPIAGSERSGVDASSADLFVDHRVILTPTAETDAAALALIRDMWLSTGAEVVELVVDEHDAILAATSHLPHVLAYSLVDALARSELSEDIFRFAAGGFRDFTRIASSDPIMWRDIALANRDELLKAIDSFTAHLGELRQAMADADVPVVDDDVAIDVDVDVRPPISTPAPPAVTVAVAVALGDPGAAVTVSHAESPVSGMRVVADCEPIGILPGVVVPAVPVAVVIARAVHDHAMVVVTAHVPRCVADVHHRGGMTVDIDVSNLVHRAGRRNRVDDIRDFRADDPRTQRIEGFVPHRFMAAVVTHTHADHRVRGVDCKLHRGALDRLEFGLAVVLHVEALVTSLDGCRLWDVGVVDRVLSLDGARHAGEQVGVLRILGNLREALGKCVGCDKGPRAVLERRRGIPPPGHQQEVLGAEPQQVGVCIGHHRQVETRKRGEFRIVFSGPPPSPVTTRVCRMTGVVLGRLSDGAVTSTVVAFKSGAFFG